MHVLARLFALAVLAADIWAIINILQSRASVAAKTVWTLVILLLPLVGLIAWLFAGPRAGGVRNTL